MWEFWRRHKRKLYTTLGILGGGYVVYKVYDAWKCSLKDLEKQHTEEMEAEERIKSQIHSHFVSVQRIADTTTLPHVIHLLDTQFSETLDLTHLMQKLLQAKDQPNTLSTAEKLELWNRLNVLCFTRLASSLWSMAILNLFIRIQVNILSRHLYVDTARGLGSPSHLDEAELIDKNDEQQFLACADYLSNYGLPSLISNAEAATMEILKGKDLKALFNDTLLGDTLVHILNSLMITESPHHWVEYLIPEDAGSFKFLAPPSRSSDLRPGKFELLMEETRAVLSSSEFANIVELSLRRLVSVVLEDLSTQCGENTLRAGIPLARLIPRLAQMGQLVLSDPHLTRYIEILKSIPEVELFFTVLYSTMPTS